MEFYITELLESVELARDELTKYREEDNQLSECAESAGKAITAANYWLECIEDGNEIPAADVKELMESMQEAEAQTEAYLRKTGWKELNVRDAHFAFSHAVSYLESFLKDLEK